MPKVRALLVNGAINNLGNRYFNWPLHLAAKSGNIEILQLLLNHGMYRCTYLSKDTKERIHFITRNEVGSAIIRACEEHI
jgi:ankyrin repeat protein